MKKSLYHAPLKLRLNENDAYSRDDLSSRTRTRRSNSIPRVGLGEEGPLSESWPATLADGWAEGDKLSRWFCGKLADLTRILPASHKQPGIGTRWVLEIDDVRKMFADLKTNGAKVKDVRPREEGWGFCHGYSGPDGKPFAILETREPSANTDWAKAGKKI